MGQARSADVRRASSVEEGPTAPMACLLVRRGQGRKDLSGDMIQSEKRRLSSQ